MKNKLFTGITLLGLTVFMLTSCSKLPQAEIDATNASIEQAKTAGANEYAHDAFVLLQDSMSKVVIGIESQNSKFIKNYTEAKEQLAGLVKLADEVKLQAEAGKEATKVEIQATIAEVKTLIESNRQLVLQAPKGKEGTSALVAIKAEIDAVEASVNETNTLFETGDFIAALDKVKAAKEKANALNTELTDVIAKYNMNVKGKKS